MAAFGDKRLVIFDIDGTLLATNRFWLDVGRRAVTTVYRRHGVDAPLPADGAFLGAIGQPMGVFWQHVLPEAQHRLAPEIESEAQELEEAAFRQGLGAMYPGAAGLLRDLHSAGRSLALASNCGLRYLRGFIGAFDLAPLLAEARCVDIPGIASKADMIGDILLHTGNPPEAAVMIGDRDSDRDAAAANGVAFLLFTGGFDPLAPRPGDGVARDYAELRKLLLPDDGRTRGT
jgi:phosphoglycolate phosphatase-like HAD superfamily hydrolase